MSKVNILYKTNTFIENQTWKLLSGLNLTQTIIWIIQVLSIQNHIFVKNFEAFPKHLNVQQTFYFVPFFMKEKQTKTFFKKFYVFRKTKSVLLQKVAFFIFLNFSQIGLVFLFCIMSVVLVIEVFQNICNVYVKYVFSQTLFTNFISCLLQATILSKIIVLMYFSKNSG